MGAKGRRGDRAWGENELPECPWWMHKAVPVLFSCAVHLIILWIAGYVALVMAAEKKRKPPPAIVCHTEYFEQEFYKPLKLGVLEKPCIEEERYIEMPVVVLEEEFELTRDIPRGTSFANLSNKNLHFTSCNDAFGTGGGAAGAYGQRWGKGSLARKGGGSGIDTDLAIMAALRWLQRHQDEDGKWEPDGFQKNCDSAKGLPCCGKATGNGLDKAITSLALLAFITHGHTHETGDFTDTVKRGLDWLIEHEPYTIGGLTKLNDHTTLMAATALCEAYAVTRDHTLRKPSQRALQIVQGRDGERHRWHHTDAIGWGVLSLRAAESAGLKVRRSMYDGAIGCLDSKTEANGWCGRRSGRRGNALPTMTAVNVVCRLLSGQKKNNPSVLKGMDILKANTPRRSSLSSRKANAYYWCFQYWYFATYAMYKHGGEKWLEWKKAIHKALLANQCVGG